MSRKRLVLILLGGLAVVLGLSAWILDKSGVFVRALKPQAEVIVPQYQQVVSV